MCVHQCSEGCGTFHKKIKKIGVRHIYTHPSAPHTAIYVQASSFATKQVMLRGPSNKKNRVYMCPPILHTGIDVPSAPRTGVYV
jgi:hypothetical protein